MRIDTGGMPVWSKTFVGTNNDEFVGVVALPTGDRLMPGGVVAYGNTDTGTISSGMWLVRTNVDGMVASLPDSGFTTVNGRARWTPGQAHALFTLAPSEVPSTVQVSDSAVGPLAAAFANVQVGG
jgi:hypothetical protein